MVIAMPSVGNNKVVFAIGSTITFFCLCLVLLQWHWPEETYTVPVRDRDRRFAFVVPANNPSPELCKTIISGLALGYPSPIIINWGVDHRPLTHWAGGRNLPKVPGFVAYLEAAMHPDAHPSERLEEDDIVLLVDAYDVWFQLPAQVMLERYHKINKEANERLQKEWNKHHRGPMPMRQTIIAASGKRCDEKLTKMGTRMQCDLWPESPLRDDLYGPDTDKDKVHWMNHRPRWINGGLYIGPAGDLRRLFRRALFTLQTGIGKGIKMRSEQSLNAEVIAEQEVYREWQRSNYIPEPNAAAMMSDKLEYSIGLDYAQELSVQTQWAQDRKGRDQGAFITLGNQASIDKHSENLGISPVRLHGLPDDIKSAPNPLAEIQPGANWTDMRLYADFFTESVPAVLHHNGVGSLKKHRSTWWDRPWYYHHLRQLLQIRMKKVGESGEPLATVRTEEGRIRYWAASAESSNKLPRKMKKTVKHQLPNMEFDDICRHRHKTPGEPNQEWWEEVFRDDGGSWEL
ncbi:hypothetical protein FLONG3_4938 [Fusarium longipes]|uniref:Uncharacterized protein n=1 Tax=Fusarium longipes TaxID=694270 RepID=A0A395SY17_9HYPO|nr:hypothetical protein FLONG3_4938 [Fusarium longipes]